MPSVTYVPSSSSATPCVPEEDDLKGSNDIAGQASPATGAGHRRSKRSTMRETTDPTTKPSNQQSSRSTGIRRFSPIGPRSDAGRSGLLSADSTSDPQWALLALSARPGPTHPTAREPRSTIAMREQAPLTRPMLANARRAGSCVLPRSRFRPKGESSDGIPDDRIRSLTGRGPRAFRDQPRLREDAALGRRRASRSPGPGCVWSP